MTMITVNLIPFLSL
jgi:hypothetical protein